MWNATIKCKIIVMIKIKKKKQKWNMKNNFAGDYKTCSLIRDWGKNSGSDLDCSYQNENNQSESV